MTLSRHTDITRSSQLRTTGQATPNIVAVMLNLSSSRKGAAAEAEIAAALIRLDLLVLRPACEGGRYDLAIDTGREILRVQCKWAPRRGDVLTVRCVTSRHTPRGYLRSTYSADEIDAIALYAPDTDGCYLIPVAESQGHKALSLRIGPTRNHQATHVRWARDYELRRSLKRNWNVWHESPADDVEMASRAVGCRHLGL